MIPFLKINKAGDRTIFINPKNVIAIDISVPVSSIRCSDGSVYNICIGQDMSKTELMNAITSITNTYMINEQNSSIG